MNAAATDARRNRRILLVDDNRSIHEDFRKILTVRDTATDSGLAAMEAELFGDDAAVVAPPIAKGGFSADSAYQGQEALQLVEKAIATNEPYAMAFVDVRMPPGWDGVETTERLWQVDPDLQIVICTAYSDYSWDDLIGRLGQTDRLLILKKPFDPVEVLQLAHAMTEKWRLTRAARMQLDELETVVHERTAALRSEIEVRRKTEADLQLAKETAEGASRAKSTFLANMSHEIRTPMNGVIGMCQLLLDTQLTSEQRDLVNTLFSSGETLLSLINDILDISKIEADKLVLENTTFSVREVVENVARVLVQKAEEKQLEFIVDVDPGISRSVTGDPVRVRQILFNLIGNAIKFTTTGEVAVNVRLVDASAESCTVDFAVRDTGMGIEPAVLQSLFQPFTQADSSITRRFGGTGLGLAICKRLVSMMGGSIEVDSASGKGSTFQFRLSFPFAKGASTAESRPTASLAGIRTLIVDDNATNRKLLRGLLARWEVDFAEVESGKAAVAHMQRAADEGRPVRLVLLDYNMSDLDGLETARRIRALPGVDHPGIVLLTSHCERPGNDHLKAHGIDACLIKPICKQPLLDCLLQLTGRGSRGGNDESPAAEPARTEITATGLRILIVEDNVVNQKVARLLLRRLGYRADIANNGREAVAAIAETPYDLVFMDCQMPEMDGYEATRHIRAREAATGEKRLPIIAMTACALHGDREQCLAAGMDDFITKPVQADTLEAIFERYATPVSEIAP